MSFCLKVPMLEPIQEEAETEKTIVSQLEMKKVGDEEGEGGEHVESERSSGGERQLGGGQQVSAKCNLLIDSISNVKTGNKCP